MEDREFDETNNPRQQQSVQRFEEMLRQNERYFFDTPDLETIIEYYLSTKDYDKALEAAHIGTEQHPYTASFWLNKGVVYMQTGSYQKALEMLEKVEEQGEHTTELWSQKGDLYVLMGDYEAAAHAFDSALACADSQEDRESIYLDLAFVYQCEEYYTQALGVLEECLTYHPKSQQAVQELALCIERLEDYEQGIPYFEQVVDRHPYGHKGWYYLGICYQKVGLLERALTAFDYAMLTDGQFEMAYEGYADTLFLMERYEEAVSAYQEWQQQLNYQEESLKKIGQCYEALQCYEKARYYFNEALQQLDGRGLGDELWFLRGRTYYEEGKLTQAQHCFTKAISLFEEGRYYRLLGETHRALEEYEAALEAFERAYQVAPNNVKINLSYAWFLWEQELAGEAIALLEDFEEEYPCNARVAFVLGGLQFSSGYTKQGVMNIEKGLAENANEAVVLFDYFPALADDTVILQTLDKYR